MILSAQSIRRRCTDERLRLWPGSQPLVSPFCERSVHAETGMSYGLSSCGYDVRLDDGVTSLRGSSKIARNATVLMNPSRVGQYYVGPGRMVLAATIERFSLPHNLCMRVLDKSSWARRGLTVQNTIAEPGWRGYLTLEIINHGTDPIWLSPGTPIAQVVFEQLDEPTEQPYPERGKYQNQARGPQPSRRET